MEIWKDIDGFEGYYQVSNYGRVRSLDRYVVANKNGGEKLLKGKIMKLTKVRNNSRNEETNYVCVNLRKEGTNRVALIHQLVGVAFLKNEDGLPVINHIDGDKSNNFVKNLEWCSYKYNNIHALENNLRKPRGNEVLQFDLDKNNLIDEYKSISEASRKTGVNRSSISHYLNGRSKFAGGYHWEYK